MKTCLKLWCDSIRSNRSTLAHSKNGKAEKKNMKNFTRIRKKNAETRGRFGALKLITINIKGTDNRWRRWKQMNKHKSAAATTPWKWEQSAATGTSRISFHSMSFVHIYSSFNGAVDETLWNARAIFSSHLAILRSRACGLDLNIVCLWKFIGIVLPCQHRPVLLPNCFRIRISVVYIRLNISVFVWRVWRMRAKRSRR